MSKQHLLGIPSARVLRHLMLVLILVFVSRSAEAGPSLEWLSSTDMPLGTHRPEILVTPGGDLIVIVVDRDGDIRHKGYRYDSDLNLIGEAFPVTSFTETYGWPADHRAVIANGEILVTY